jgi:hypothetical protein
MVKAKLTKSALAELGYKDGAANVRTKKTAVKAKISSKGSVRKPVKKK